MSCCRKLHCNRDFVHSLRQHAKPAAVTKSQIKQFIDNAEGPLPYNKMGNNKAESAAQIYEGMQQLFWWTGDLSFLRRLQPDRPEFGRALDRVAAVTDYHHTSVRRALLHRVAPCYTATRLAAPRLTWLFHCLSPGCIIASRLAVLLPLAWLNHCLSPCCS